MQFYTRPDGTTMSTPQVASNTILLAIFVAVIVYCFNNIRRFWRLRTYPIEMFYGMTLLNLGGRCAYFILKFFQVTTYWTLILLIVPEVFTLGVIISQIMIYTIMHSEITNYMVQHERLNQTRASSALTSESITAAATHEKRVY
jgi:hypothetical protein